MIARCAAWTELSRLKASVVCHAVGVSPRIGKSEMENFVLLEPG